MSATPPDAILRRLLDGVLLRLARRPDVSDYILRGGVLLRHWFGERPVPRPVEDIDLVATFGYDLDGTARRFLPVFAEELGDGVVYDAESLRHEGIWLETGTPGMRVFVTGWLAEDDGKGFARTEIDFHVDLTFGPYPRPAPVVVALPTTFGTAEVWACRPEAVAGHKVQALWHRAMLGWRPKDLNDLRLLLAGVPMDAADLRDAIRRYLADVRATEADARELFGPAAWWGTKMASARWQDFVASPPGRGVPRDLAEVVAEVAGRLAPILEGSP